MLVLFLHNSYGTLEFPDCGNPVGADCMGNLRWANTEPSMHFRKTNTEFLFPVLLPTPNFTSQFNNITINLLHHDECNIISQVTVN